MSTNYNSAFYKDVSQVLETLAKSGDIDSDTMVWIDCHPLRDGLLVALGALMGSKKNPAAQMAIQAFLRQLDHKK